MAPLKTGGKHLVSCLPNYVYRLYESRKNRFGCPV